MSKERDMWLVPDNHSLKTEGQGWRERLAFLDNVKQDAGHTIVDRELTIRLLLAVLWQSNREDDRNNQEDWQEGTDHSSQGNLYGAIHDALKYLGFDTDSEAHAVGEYNFFGAVSTAPTCEACDAELDPERGHAAPVCDDECAHNLNQPTEKGTA